MRRSIFLFVMLSLMMVLMASLIIPAAAFDPGDNDIFSMNDLDDFTEACLKAYVLNAMLGFDGFVKISETDDLWIFLGGIPGEFQWDPVYITINKQTGEAGTMEPINKEDFEILMTAIPLEIPEEFVVKESTFLLEPSDEVTDTADESSDETDVCPTPLSCADGSTGTCAKRCGSDNSCLERCLRSGSISPEHRYDPSIPSVDDGLPEMSDAFLADMALLAEKGMLGTTPYNTSYAAYPDMITLNRAKLHTMDSQLLGRGKNVIVHFNLDWESGSKKTAYEAAACGMLGRWDGSDYIMLALSHSGNAEIGTVSADGWETLHDKSFGKEAASGSASVTILLLDSSAAILCDGKVTASSSTVPLTAPGDWGFFVESGTESGFGTRCKYSNIEILAFE